MQIWKTHFLIANLPAKIVQRRSQISVRTNIEPGYNLYPRSNNNAKSISIAHLSVGSRKFPGSIGRFCIFHKLSLCRSRHFANLGPCSRHLSFGDVYGISQWDFHPKKRNTIYHPKTHSADFACHILFIHQITINNHNSKVKNRFVKTKTLTGTCVKVPKSNIGLLSEFYIKSQRHHNVLALVKVYD